MVTQHSSIQLPFHYLQAEHTLAGVAPALDDTSGPSARSQVAWHPDGGMLAVPGTHHDVICYDRDTAEVMEEFKVGTGSRLAEGGCGNSKELINLKTLCTPHQVLVCTSVASFVSSRDAPLPGCSQGVHKSRVALISWSPSGRYLLTAGASDGLLVLWDAEEKEKGELDVMALPSAKHGCPPTGLQWSPTHNAVAVIDASGMCGVWSQPVPPHMPCPTLKPTWGTANTSEYS